MSLAALALRIAAVEALKGRTMAGGLVVDTYGELPPSDVDEARFAIVVDTPHATDRQIKFRLTLQVLVRTVVATNRGHVVLWQPPMLNRETERALDILAHEVDTVLKTADGGWTDAFLALADKPTEVSVETPDPNAKRVISFTMSPPSFASKGRGWAEFLGELETAEGLETEREVFRRMRAHDRLTPQVLELPFGYSADDAAEISQALLPVAEQAAYVAEEPSPQPARRARKPRKKPAEKTAPKPASRRARR